MRGEGTSNSRTRMSVEQFEGNPFSHQNGFADDKERVHSVDDKDRVDSTNMSSSCILPIIRRPGTLNSLLVADEYRGGRDIGCVVLGILMVDEREVSKACVFHGGNDNRLASHLNTLPVILGSVLMEKKSPYYTVLADELRNKILKQVPTLSGNFVFLSKEGWPVSKEQERLVHIDQIVTEHSAVVLRKQFEKTRAGVLADEKDHLGFIFIDLNSSLRQVRDAILEQLKEKKLLRNEYKFLEKMGFPVTREQENILTVADTIVNSTLHILTAPCSNYYEPDKNWVVPKESTHIFQPRLSLGKPSLSLPPSSEMQDVTDSNRSVNVPIRAKKLRKSIFRDGPKKVSMSQGLVAKPILISYVRAEAASHALTLKENLSNLGFSVYLDVHEIKSGADWQDALNYAVSHCELFVPLITPMYGKTQWTNREVKLADVLNKFILPINFLEQWPPECLAIQFASTQYIAWKPPSIDISDHVRGLEIDKNSSDYRIWHPVYIKKVSEEIASKLLANNTVSLRSDSFRQRPLSSSMVTPRSKTVRISNTSEARKSGLFDEVMDMKERLTKLVVISAHPKQLLFADTIKKMLEEVGYQVWCSTELIEDPQEGDSLGAIAYSSVRGLTPIPEGEISSTRNQSLVQFAGNKKVLIRTDTEVLTSSAENKRALQRLSSQMSTTSVVSDSLTPDKIDRLKKFQEKADLAGVIIVLASEAYFKSTTSRQQGFYCEHRKKIILVQYDNAPAPALFSMLMGNDMIKDPEGPNFSCALKARVKRELDPASAVTPRDAALEAKMQYLVSFMKKNLPVLESCVYVSGSSRLLNDRSNDICMEIGKALAQVKNINVVTGGFYGAGDITARAFEEALQNNPRSPVAPGPTTTGPIFHILPIKDSKDFTKKATQNEEGSFEPVPYGNTLFLGDSVKERESVVARLFDICIVIEGGPGSAHEVEEFIWNDHYVIPIMSTGGAAGGDFGVPLKIFETPPCVQETDWTVLSDKEASAECVAKAVVNIVMALKNAIATHTSKQNQDKLDKVAKKAKIKRSKRSRRLTRNAKSLGLSNENIMSISDSTKTMDQLVDNDTQSVSCIGHNNRWQKIIRFLRPSRLPAPV